MFADALTMGPTVSELGTYVCRYVPVSIQTEPAKELLRDCQLCVHAQKTPFSPLKLSEQPLHLLAWEEISLCLHWWLSYVLKARL